MALSCKTRIIGIIKEEKSLAPSLAMVFLKTDCDRQNVLLEKKFKSVF